MKKVVVISSTPRVNGNSEVIAKEFARGAEAAGHKVEVIKLRDYSFKYCIACNACATSGICYHHDGMNGIAQKLIDADVIAFATPVYFYSMSGQLKVFIDRLMPYYTKIHSDIYLIASQWDDNVEIIENTFNAIRGCTRDCFEGCEEKGVIRGVGLGERGEAKNSEAIMTEAFNMGKNC